MKKNKTKKSTKEPILIDWEVEKILKERKRRKKKEYLVKWVGIPNPTWEPESSLDNCEELLKEYLLNEVIKKCTKNEKKNAKSPNPKSPKSQKMNKKPKNVPKNGKKQKKNETNKEEDQSTFCNSLSCRKHIPKRLPQNNIGLYSAYQEDDIMPYDIEIVEEQEVKMPKETKKKIKNDIKDNIIIDDVETFQIQKKKENKIDSEVKNDQKEQIDENYNNQMLNGKDINVNEVEEEDVSVNSHEAKDNPVFLNKKRNNNDVVLEEVDDHGNGKMNVKEIYSMKVPKNRDEGIKLNIKYKKNNKIYIEEFDTKSGELSTPYLITYYEAVLYDLLKGQNYSKMLSFDD